MIPNVAIDETDKTSYETHHSGVRKRARGVSATLDQTLAQIEATSHPVVHDDTVVDLLQDEPGHIRLPNNDDETVAPASHLQHAPAPVTSTGACSRTATAHPAGPEAPRVPENASQRHSPPPDSAPKPREPTLRDDQSRKPKAHGMIRDGDVPRPTRTSGAGSSGPR
ncbi:hypothetical protein EAO75_01540 [Streptomyces sp. uw30]|nr:hypothetical protein EAO75_01540 [Streptomyces sp. uw30]